MKSGHSELPLLAQRGAARVFKRLDTLASFLKDLGIRTATLELDQWDGGDDAEP